MKAWQAKERAIEILKGGPIDEYRQILRYIFMLNSINPNSHFIMHKLGENEFMYLLITLHLMRSDFKFCKLVVMVDKAHWVDLTKELFF